MSFNVIQDLLKPLSEGRNLTHDHAVRAFQIIMNGGATPAQMGAFLIALKIKGETVDEITAGAEVLRIKASRVDAPAGTIDVCGTGGDGAHSLNISTAVSFTLAGAGVPVAKHGNRAVSSSSGSADVLEALGVNIQARKAQAERCLRDANICFLFAPLYHTAMRHVGPVRQELGFRTVFNLLGPLANPAQPVFQMVGVYKRELVEPMAQVLQKLGLSRAWVVHGSDGTDELTLSGVSYVAELKDGQINCFEVSGQDANLPNISSAQLRGGDASHNANALRELLLGQKSPYRDVVLFNASAALIVCGKAQTLAEGVLLAADSIDSGTAYKCLQKLMELSHAK